MIRRMMSLATAGIAVLAISLLPGCDKEDNPTDPGTGGGMSTDSSLVSSVVNDRVVEAPFQSLELSAALLETQTQGATGRMAGFSSLGDGYGQGEVIVITLVADYQYDDSWHVFDFEAIVADDLTFDTVDIAGIDSVQVLVDGQPIQHLNDTLDVDGISARAHLNWALRDGSAAGAVHHSIDVDADLMSVDTLVTIDGYAHDTLSGMEITDSASCDLELTCDLTLNNLQLLAPVEDGECPEDGDFSVSVGIDAACRGTGGNASDSARVNGTWTVSAAVNDDHSVTVTYTGAILSWTVTEDCDEASPVARRGGWWTRPVRASQSL